MKSSAIPGFYKLSIDERVRLVKEFAGLSEAEAGLLKGCALPAETANRMIENVVGIHGLPLGIATYFTINGRDCLIPMALEEPSVVAAASHAAKLAREAGGFHAEAGEPLMSGQIQLVGVANAGKAAEDISAHAGELLASLRDVDAVLVKHGGGPRELGARVLETARGKMVVAELVVDVRDAMGANAVNTMCEKLAPRLEKITGGRARLRILSNLAVRRLARASAVWKKEVIGEDAVEGVLDAWALAEADSFRCATHNKGVMNGVDAVAVATGNDWRALEAGAHAYAARSGKYAPLTRYEKDGQGNLTGFIELPIAAGVVGGATRTHPLAQLALKIMGVATARELAMVMACVGLANNFAALRALVTEGIQRGHMALHARNIAVMAGAKGSEIDAVAEALAAEGNVRIDRAREVLARLRKRR
ncbi:MAG: hydroxymethylglutaryl-CoA reductase, degradative [Candidatus Micrarchaeia archaeon]